MADDQDKESNKQEEGALLIHTEEPMLQEPPQAS
jgi:hypothetical protein